MNVQQLMQKLNIGGEHKGKIEDINKYIKDHRIQELFNEMLTNILYNRPPSAKLFIIESLKNVQKVKPDDPHSNQIYQMQEPFLSTEDFEAIFESYDILGIQTVPIAYLIQALHVVGVENGKQVLENRYPELVQEETINKVTFVYVLEEEHKRVGFSYNNQHSPAPA
eukprot:403358764